MILGGRHKCMTPKLVGIRWFLITQINIKLRGISVKFAWFHPLPPDFRGDLEHDRILDFRGGGFNFLLHISYICM